MHVRMYQNAVQASHLRPGQGNAVLPVNLGLLELPQLLLQLRDLPHKRLCTALPGYDKLPATAKPCNKTSAFSHVVEIHFCVRGQQHVTFTIFLADETRFREQGMGQQEP